MNAISAVNPFSYGMAAHAGSSTNASKDGASKDGAASSGGRPEAATGASKTMLAVKVLSPRDQALVMELKRIDMSVKSHEMAHLAAGAGVVTGGASYTYRRGPDGGQYAVAGEVPISLSSDMDKPRETLQKAEQVQRAALAPSDPSGQDLSVAAAAAAIAAQARTLLSKQQAQALVAAGERRQSVDRYA